MDLPDRTGKLLPFPPPSPGSAVQDWGVRVLQSRDNLVSALDYLRIAYNEMLAGRPVKPAEEILAHVDAMVRSVDTPAPFKIISGIRIRAAVPPATRPKILLLFPPR